MDLICLIELIDLIYLTELIKLIDLIGLIDLADFTTCFFISLLVLLFILILQHSPAAWSKTAANSRALALYRNYHVSPILYMAYMALSIIIVRSVKM